MILGVARKDDANYLDACRTKRRWWDASSLLGRDVYFEAGTVERAKSCPSSVVTMIVSGAEVLRGSGDVISAKGV